MRVIVIGGGAAGFFAGMSAKVHHPGAEVLLLEKSDKVLSKVRISGGGRCNVTHDQPEPRKLALNYPRGSAFLRRSFARFAVKETVRWFLDRRVELVAEADGRMFPRSNTSGTIIHALTDEADRLGVQVRMGTSVLEVVPRGVPGVPSFEVVTSSAPLTADRVIVTTGGHPRSNGYAFLNTTGHTLVPPVPSLFTFNMPDEPIRELMGVSQPVRAALVGMSIESHGPLLITHWGMSGPAILRLSAWGARELHDCGYDFQLRVNWANGANEEYLRGHFNAQAERLSRKQAGNADPIDMPRRLWTHLLDRVGIPLDRPWGSLSKADRDRLIDRLTNSRYSVHGKTTFKEEFVTAGGVDLNEVDPLTMESRRHPGLHFAGEVLDIDGITGGFNFQAAWTTGFLAGRLGT